ncbi:MAG: hypothetical protein ABSF76_08010 [Opitutaceae bacterium]|jgi:hypothetical protein
MKVKFIQLSFLLLASGALIGCMSSAKELNFEAVLTGTPEQRADQAHDYFIAVTKMADLEIVSESWPTKSASDAVTGIIYARAFDSERINVSFSIGRSDRGCTLLLVISGNVKSQAAERVSNDAQRIFARMFPTSSLEPFSRPNKSFAIGP